MRLILILTITLLAGCGTLPPREAPRSFVEEVAYQEGLARAAEKTVDDLTCHKGYDAKGACLDAGKPIRPALAVDLLSKLKMARGGLRTAVALPESGGVCLVGKVQSPAACLQAATQLLLEVEVALRKQQGG